MLVVVYMKSRGSVGLGYCLTLRSRSRRTALAVVVSRRFVVTAHACTLSLSHSITRSSPVPHPPQNHYPAGREVDSTSLSAAELERLISSSSDRFMLPPSAVSPDAELATRYRLLSCHCFHCCVAVIVPLGHGVTSASREAWLLPTLGDVVRSCDMCARVLHVFVCFVRVCGCVCVCVRVWLWLWLWLCVFVCFLRVCWSSLMWTLHVGKRCGQGA